jgi:type I restriction enzyme R subunit
MGDTGSLNKRDLSERDICTKFITPAIREIAGWNNSLFFEELTLGKIIVHGKKVARGVKDRADYILFYQKNLPLAVIEAKDNNCEMGAGMQQALRYGEMLNVPLHIVPMETALSSMTAPRLKALLSVG